MSYKPREGRSIFEKSCPKCKDWNPAQIKKHHYNKYGASNLNFFDVYRAYWIARAMKVAIVVANCHKDSKVAVDYNTGWN